MKKAEGAAKSEPEKRVPLLACGAGLHYFSGPYARLVFCTPPRGVMSLSF